MELTVTNNEIDISEAGKGDTFKAYGKRFTYLGTGNEGKDAFFANTRKGARYASYAGVKNGKVYILDLTKMDVTAEHICKTYGF